MGPSNLNSGLILPLERLVTLVVPHPEMAGLPSQPHGNFLVWVTFVALQARIGHNCNPPTCGPGPLRPSGTASAHSISPPLQGVFLLFSVVSISCKSPASFFPARTLYTFRPQNVLSTPGLKVQPAQYETNSPHRRPRRHGACAASRVSFSAPRHAGLSEIDGDMKKPEESPRWG